MECNQTHEPHISQLAGRTCFIDVQAIEAPYQIGWKTMNINSTVTGPSQSAEDDVCNLEWPRPPLNILRIGQHRRTRGVTCKGSLLIPNKLFALSNIPHSYDFNCELLGDTGCLHMSSQHSYFKHIFYGWYWVAGAPLSLSIENCCAMSDHGLIMVNVYIDMVSLLSLSDLTGATVV